MVKIGDRVGAILNQDDDGTINFLGFGAYVGDEVPLSAAGDMAEISREIGTPNPKIVLDNGKIVWGCECWWGSEKRVAETLNGHKVINVDIDTVRANWRGEDVHR